MTKTPKEILICARKLIARKATKTKPAGWTRRFYAKNAEGRSVDPKAKEACCFCAIGAVEHCTPLGDSVSKTLDVLQKAVPGTDIVNFNDVIGRTQAEVVAVFDAAIASLD